MDNLLFIKELKEGKNLLAFSHGTDSTALFYILLKLGIDFDMAMVDYGVRKESKTEVAASLKLAQKWGKKLFLKTCDEKIKSDFENKARDLRYKFFETIIKEHSYTNLILAHQLNDALEWFLMRLSKGSGLSNMLLKPKSFCQKDGFSYTKLRPMYMMSKDEIYEALKGVEYFYDKSNDDKKYFRNEIRHEFSDIFIKKFKDGVKKSFKYLLKDETNLNSNYHTYKNIYISSNFYGLDKCIKRLGYVSTKAQKDEINKQLKNSNQTILGGKICICKMNDFFIAFKNEEKTKKFPKEYKEICRKNDIPYHLRVYIFENSLNLNDFLTYINSLKIWLKYVKLYVI